MSPNELAARASPTAPRRSDLPKLDSSLLHNLQQQQFPLPASMPPASVAAVGMCQVDQTDSLDRAGGAPSQNSLYKNKSFLAQSYIVTYIRN